MIRVRAEAFEAEGSGLPPALGFLFQLAGGGDVDVPINVGSNPLISERDIEEDFPKNRADSDFFSFYWFVVVYPIAALLTIAHLILHGVPFLGFILSITVSSIETDLLFACLHVQSFSLTGGKGSLPAHPHLGVWLWGILGGGEQTV